MLYIILGVLALIVVVLTVLLLRTAGRAKTVTIELESAQADLRRLERELSEARQPVAAASGQPNAADLAVGTSTAVELGTAVLEAGHKTLAEGAFKVLDSFESTRGASRVAQKLHDDNVDGVYSAINGLNRALGDAFRGFTATSAQTAPARPRKTEEDAPEPAAEV